MRSFVCAGWTVVLLGTAAVAADLEIPMNPVAASGENARTLADFVAGRLPHPIRRIRFVTIPEEAARHVLEIARGGEDTIRLRLFPGADFRIAPHGGARSEAGYVRLDGEAVGEREATATFFYEAGDFGASVSSGMMTYSVDRNPDGTYRIIEVDQSLFEEGDDMVTETPNPSNAAKYRSGKGFVECVSRCEPMLD